MWQKVCCTYSRCFAFAFSPLIFLFPFLNSDTVPQSYNRHFLRVRILGMKFKGTQIHFTSVMFWLPCGGKLWLAGMGHPLRVLCIDTSFFSIIWCRKRLDCWEIVHLTAYYKKKLCFINVTLFLLITNESHEVRQVGATNWMATKSSPHFPQI